MENQYTMGEIHSAMQVLEERIGYKFTDQALLRQAVTHSSFTNEQRMRRTKNYERLEFLGDAVLELVSSEFLYQRNRNMSEGELTKTRASMVCEPSLAFCARDLDLGNFILLGKGEEGTGEPGQYHIRCDGGRDRRNLPGRRHGAGESVYQSFRPVRFGG